MRDPHHIFAFTNLTNREQAPSATIVLATICLAATGDLQASVATMVFSIPPPCRRGRPQQSENLALSTRHSIMSSLGRTIKGSTIHSLEGSCLGYCVMPYFCGFDQCSWRYVNPALKNAAFLLAQTERLQFHRVYLPSP